MVLPFRFLIVQSDSFCGFYSGLACRPADINLPFSNPGWGDWSRSFGGWGGLCFCFWCCGQVIVSAFACNATGLDAVQRLEQKKTSTPAIPRVITIYCCWFLRSLFLLPRAYFETQCTCRLMKHQLFRFETRAVKMISML